MKKKAKKTAANKGSAKANKSKPVNLTAPDAEVTGQGLATGGLLCAEIHCIHNAACGVRG